jgi:OOP family OmpA-OmpF porin
MTSAGFGKSKPIADNATDEGRAINRRVELKVTEAAAGAPAPIVESPMVPADAPMPASAAPDTAAPSGGTAVSIAQFAFGPETLTVAAGSVVTWTNRDDATHTVKFGDGASGNLGTGSSYRRAFSAPGIYPYQCGVHPYMKGQIVVK